MKFEKIFDESVQRRFEPVKQLLRRLIARFSKENGARNETKKFVLPSVCSRHSDSTVRYLSCGRRPDRANPKSQGAR